MSAEETLVRLQRLFAQPLEGRNPEHRLNRADEIVKAALPDGTVPNYEFNLTVGLYADEDGEANARTDEIVDALNALPRVEFWSGTLTPSDSTEA